MHSITTLVQLFLPFSLHLDDHPYLFALALVVGLLGFWTTYSRYFHRRSKLPLPPGPNPHPLIGHLFKIPLEKPWIVYNEWAKQYGDVMYLEALGQRILVLNTLKAVDALLVQRAVNYSHRAWTPVINLVRVQSYFSMMNYGPEWRAARKVFHQFYAPATLSKFHPMIEQEVSMYLRRLLADSSNFRDETRLLFGAIIMRTSYGVEDFEYNRKLIFRAGRLVEEFTTYMAPGRLLVNTFHSLRHIPAWVPGAGWKRNLEELAQISDDILYGPFGEVEERVNAGKGSAFPSLATKLVTELPDKADPEYETRKHISRHTAAQSYIAGADTTVSAALALLLALAMYPTVQRKAQAEIDSVVGADRLPTFEDLEHLPYVRAIVKEGDRWHTVTPIGIPHVSGEEDEFNGYRIPAKTVVFANSWAIMHDPTVFEDPFTFKPERYLKDGALNPDILDPEVTVFGHGRRICPGRHFSADAVTMMIASLLSCFDIKQSLDAQGEPVPLVYDVETSFVTIPKPFECDIVSRGNQRVLLLQPQTI